MIRTKVHMPDRRATLVSRSRLFVPLAEHPAVRLILVAAPAGFGKTTCLVDWLHGSRQAAAWVSLDERDNDVNRFLLYLIAAIQTRIADFGREVLAGLQLPSPPDDQLVMDALLDELTAAAPEFVLVLDDYHIIHNAVVHRCLTTMIDYAPPGITVALTSRSVPDLPLPRWRARGQLLEITAADLRFDARETGDFLSATMGLSLSAEEILELERRTEGWAAGLQLAALSVRSAVAQPAVVPAVTGSDRHISDYLVAEVLARQPAEIREFLEATSLVDAFNSSLCDYLLETADSQSRLETIDRENLFLIALDNRRDWYRYHPLFGDVLRARLARDKGAAGVVRLHRRAGEWHAAQGQLDDAVRHTLAAGDVMAAAGILAETPLETLWQTDGVGSVRRWVDQLPEDALAAHPRSALLGAIANMLVGEIAATTRYAGQIADVPELSGAYGVIQAIFARNEGRADAALDLLRAALAELSADQWILAVIARLQIAIVHLEAGQLAQAATFLRATRRSLAVDTQAGLTMMLQAAAFECTAATMQGELADARRLGQEAVARARTSPHVAPMVGQLHAALAGIAYLQNELNEARAELDRALLWGERTGITDILFSAYETEIKLLCARGEDEAVLARLERLSTLYANANFPDIVSVGEAEEAAIFLRLGNLDRAMAWASTSGHDLSDPIPPRARSLYHILAGVHLAAARVYRDSGSVPAILDLAERLEEQAVRLNQVIPRISALLLQAQALDLLGNPVRAQDRLVQALALAESGRIVRVFLDSSSALLTLLRSLSGERPGDAFLALVIRAFDQEKARADVPEHPLTDRELEVLSLIAAGLSNKEIEQRLVVSHNTVRTHIKNLYSKLDVSSRTQAVRRARDLGLV